MFQTGRLPFKSLVVPSSRMRVAPEAKPGPAQSLYTIPSIGPWISDQPCTREYPARTPSPTAVATRFATSRATTEGRIVSSRIVKSTVRRAARAATIPKPKSSPAAQIGSRSIRSTTRIAITKATAMSNETKIPSRLSLTSRTSNRGYECDESGSTRVREIGLAGKSVDYRVKVMRDFAPAR